MEPIRSPQNRTVVAAGRLRRARHRREAAATLVEGPRAVVAAIEAGVTPERLFVLEGDRTGFELASAGGVTPVAVTESVLRKISDTENPAGPIAVVHIPEPAPFPIDQSVLVLVDVADPGNAGTLIRSAAAFGFAVAASGGVDLWSPKVLRAAAGAHFQTSVVGPVPALAQLRQTTIATTPAGGVRPRAWTDPVVLLMGSEAAGLPAAMIQEADVVMSIPTVAVESLNVGVAGAIVMAALVNAVGPHEPGH